MKGITQSSIPVGFIPRGRRRLKGIHDPIVVYAVSRDVNAKAPRTLPRPLILGAAGVAVVAVLVVAAIAGTQLLAKPGTAPSTKPTPVAQRVAIGALPIGMYKSVLFKPEVTFDVQTQGWTASSDVEGKLGLTRVVAPLGSVDFLRVDEVIETPCGGPAEATHPAPGPADQLLKLQGLTHLTLTDPLTVRYGGYTGRRVDVTVADSALAACAGPVGGGVTVFSVAGEIWKASPGERFSLMFVGVGDQAVTIAVSTDWTQTQSVEQLENLRVAAEQILATVRL